MQYELYLRNRNRAHLGWCASKSFGTDEARSTVLGCSAKTVRGLLSSAREAAADQAKCYYTTDPVIVARSPRTGAEVLAIFYRDCHTSKYGSREGARKLALESDVNLRGW